MSPAAVLFFQFSSSRRKPFSFSPAITRSSVLSSGARTVCRWMREVTQRPRLRMLQLVAEGIRIVARKDMQRRRDLAVDRMLDRHIDRRAAQIDDRVQLLAQPVVIVMRDDAPFRIRRSGGGVFEDVAARRRHDRHAARAQQRDIADDDLAADAAPGRERRRGHRPV